MVDLTPRFQLDSEYPKDLVIYKVAFFHRLCTLLCARGKKPTRTGGCLGGIDGVGKIRQAYAALAWYMEFTTL